MNIRSARWLAEFYHFGQKTERNIDVISHLELSTEYLKRSYYVPMYCHLALSPESLVWPLGGRMGLFTPHPKMGPAYRKIYIHRIEELQRRRLTAEQLEVVVSLQRWYRESWGDYITRVCSESRCAWLILEAKLRAQLDLTSMVTSGGRLNGKEDLNDYINGLAWMEKNPWRWDWEKDLEKRGAAHEETN